MKNLVFTFLFVLICSLTKAQTQDSIIQSGFVYFANVEQEKTGIYLSPIINFPTSKNTFEEKRTEAKILTCEKFSQDMKKYYIINAETNQRINDKRADYYYLTRTFLFIDLLLLIILSTIGYIF